MNTDFIVINSSDRELHSASSHDFEVKLSSAIEGLYQISTCSIPNTFYNINLDNNKIYFNDGKDQTAYITPGNYSSASIITAVKAAMDLESTITFTPTINAATGRMTIAGDSNYSLKFNNTTNSIAGLLGFANNETLPALTHEGSYVVNLANPSGVIVDINGNSNVSTSSHGVFGTLYFPIETNSSDITVFKSENSYVMYVNFIRTNTLKIKLRDAYGKPLNLNGANWTLCLKKCRM